MLKDNKEYLNYSKNENITFLYTFLYTLFNDTYTKDEYDIIIDYLLLLIDYNYLDDTDLQLTIEELSSNNYDKPEIVYLIEELKARLVSHYLMKSYDITKIDKLIAELDPVEDQHNAFELHAIIDKSQQD